MNATSQEKANWRPPSALKLMAAPSAASTPPTTISFIGRLRHLDRSSGFAAAALVCELIGVWLDAGN